jgi:hypothetical protein
MKPYVKDLVRIIRDATDDRYGLVMSMEFFVSLLRVRNEKLPIVEIMSIFRKHRPVLHRILSKNVAEKNPVYFILDFEGDYVTSLQSLELTEDFIKNGSIK